MPCTYVYNRRDGIFRIGQVTFCHGHSALSGHGADDKQTHQLGMPFGLWVGGHTHRPIPPTRSRKSQTVLLDRWFSNVGTLRNIDEVPYMERKDRSQWGQGLVIGEAGLWRYTESLMPQTKDWDAALLIRRMYED